ncbi:MAG: hypothetical protein HYR50_12570 [Candidatus Rokubacteria bacterium]|nr:hypothetical protein [Candidatus Rokubacteria bacterium]
MKLVDLSLELHDGFQSHGAHARTTVMDFVTHAFSAPRYNPPCRGFADKLLILDQIGRPLRIKGATGSPIRAVALLDRDW